MRILVLEDNPVDQDVLVGLLEKYGRCDILDDGELALEAYRVAIEHGDPYQLLCVDISMPNVDGIQVMEQIRAFEEENSISNKAVLFVITGHKSADTVQKAKLAGCSSYIVKPLDLTRLVAELKIAKLI